MTDADACPDCEHYDGEDPFDGRPWQCDSCGAFFPELAFRGEADA